MKMKYSLITNGRVQNAQTKDFDGNRDINDHRIQSDIYDGMDPLEQAQAGKEVSWVEGKEMNDG